MIEVLKALWGVLCALPRGIPAIYRAHRCIKRNDAAHEQAKEEREAERLDRLRNSAKYRPNFADN